MEVHHLLARKRLSLSDLSGIFGASWFNYDCALIYSSVKKVTVIRLWAQDCSLDLHYIYALIPCAISCLPLRK